MEIDLRKNIFILTIFLLFTLSYQAEWTTWFDGPPCTPLRIELKDKVGTLFETDVMKKKLREVDNYAKEFVSNLTDINLKIALSYAINYNGKTVRFGNHGTVNKDRRSPPTQNTIYNVGSISKIFTSLMFAKLLEEQRINLLATVDQFYNATNPPEYRPKYPGSKDPPQVTLHSLAQHTSGLMRNPPCLDFRSCGDEEVIDILNSIPLEYAPYQLAQYSNVGPALLAYCMSRAINVKFEDYLDDEILNPLKMKNTGFEYTRSVVSRMATGYNFDGGVQTPDPDSTLGLGWFGPSGGLYSTTSDLSNFMNDLLSNKNSKILKGSTKQVFFQPGYPNSEGASNFGLFTFENAFVSDYWVNTKVGQVEGFASSMALVPKLNFGIVALINVENSNYASTFTSFVAQTLLPAMNELMNIQPRPPIFQGAHNFIGQYGFPGFPVLTFSQHPTKIGVYRVTFIFWPVEFDAVYDPAYSSRNVISYKTTYTDESVSERSCFACSYDIYYMHLNFDRAGETVNFPAFLPFTFIKL